ncbi:MAG: GIY-YIG nuclease family protein [Alphaproteobacteria bacterium]|nr:GIY-YIG nuclease family protein [Alphaproteobacteria bacterium]
MAAARPHGFAQFVREQGFHGVYLVTTVYGEPVKVGITQDPVLRISELQTANFIELHMHRFWWTAGHQIAALVESEFKQHFKPRNIRGEWFDLPLAEASTHVERRLKQIGTWGVDHQTMINFMDERERKRCRMPASAPSPLRGWRAQQLAARHLPRTYLDLPPGA